METARQITKKRKVNPLRRARLRWCLSQREVASLLGIEPSFLSMRESSHRKPSLSVAKKLAKFYETTVEELFA